MPDNVVTAADSHALYVVGRRPASVVVTVSERGLRGMSGAGVDDVEFRQEVPAAIWTVLHNQGRRPVVQVVVGGIAVAADVSWPDLNTVRIEFASPQSGLVLLK